MKIGQYDLNQIVSGDCRNILPRLPDKCADFAFADPPYWVGFDYGNKTDKEMDHIEPEWLITELLRVSKLVAITPGVGQEYQYPKPKWKGIWHKPAAMGRNGFGGANNFEPILFYGNGHLDNDYFMVPLKPDKESEFHKCPKPILLMQKIIAWVTKPGDIVIDPVSGSGTTCKAAKMLRRNFFGIEIDPEIAERANIRIAHTQIPMLLPELEQTSLWPQDMEKEK